ncbi:hypothetical protein [Thermogutta sp.]|uniref:hypothetical protein n=1 Tax=Thermogutta sp. TaxID=1962930 RepID=UPI00321FC415
MSEKEYRTLMKTWRRKNALYPDRGRSIRPWEEPLLREIRGVIAEGLLHGHAWARTAAVQWTGLPERLFHGPPEEVVRLFEEAFERACS